MKPSGPGPGIFLYAAIIGLFSWTVSMISFARNFEGGITHEFCQYAEIGRNLLEGKGFRTSILPPYTLAYFDGRKIPFDQAHPAPVIDRFPTQAWLSALAEWTLGKNDGAIAALSAALLAACAAATYALGCLFFAPLEAAFAGIFVALDPSFQRGFVLWGLADFGFCLAVLAAAVAVCRRPASAKSEPLAWALAGALAGLAWLTRSNFIIWLPLFYASLWTLDQRGRRERLFWYTASMLAVSSPGWVHNLRSYGSLNPPDLAAGLAISAAQQTSPVLSYKAISPWGTISSHLPALLRKYAANLELNVLNMPTWWQMHLLFPLALFGFAVLHREDTPARRLARLMAAMLLLQVLVFSALRYEVLAPNVKARHFLWFAPAAFLLAARGAREAGGLLGAKRSGLALAGLINLVFFARYLLSAQGVSTHPAGLNVRDWPEIAAASRAAGERLLITNLPSQAAWYTRHHAVTLPADPDDVAAIDRLHPVGAVLISRLRPAELDNTPVWRELILQPRALARYCRANGYEAAEDFGTAVLLRRRPARGGSSAD